MGKLYEKKNFGIPVTILIALTYLIGYSLAKNLSGTLLAALIFAAAVFVFDFDDRVKNAVKHSYVFAIGIQLLYFLIELLGSVVTMFYGGSVEIKSLMEFFYSFGYIRRLPMFLYFFVTFLVNAAAIIIYAICIILTLIGKDIKIGVIANILGEAPSKNKYDQNYYKQPGYPIPPAGQYSQRPYTQPNGPGNQQVPPMQSGSPMNNKEPYVQVQPPYIQNQSVQTPVKEQDNFTQTQSGQVTTQPQDNSAQSQTVQSSAEPQDSSVQQQSVQKTDQPQKDISHVDFCPNCGKVNDNDAVYCSNCGLKLK